MIKDHLQQHALRLIHLLPIGRIGMKVGEIEDRLQRIDAAYLRLLEGELAGDVAHGVHRIVWETFNDLTPAAATGRRTEPSTWKDVQMIDEIQTERLRKLPDGTDELPTAGGP